MDNAFKYIIENGGLTSEEHYPYEGVQGDCHFKKDTTVVTMKSYVDVPTQDEGALEEALATLGPISVAIGMKGESRLGLRYCKCFYVFL
jgi:cathepsin L